MLEAEPVVESESAGLDNQDEASLPEMPAASAPAASHAPRTGLAGRRRAVVLIALASVLLAGAGVGAAAFVKSPAQVAADAGAPEPDVLTAPVDFRVLESSVIVRGKVTAGQSVEVAPQPAGDESAGRAVVTRIAVREGQQLSPGKLLMEVSGRPVFVLPGTLPVYRDLKPGSTGKDVTQLQKALRSLGHGTGSDPAGTFGAGTTAALGAFYAAVGYDPLPALDDDGEALKAAQEAVSAARRALEDVQDGASADDGEASGSDKEVRPLRPSGRELERAREDLAKAQREYTDVRAASGPMLPAGEVVYLRGFPARVSAVQGTVGSVVEGTVMTLTAGKLVVRAHVMEHQKGLVRSGLPAVILSELSGVTARGSVKSVATSPDTGNSATGSGEGGGEGEADSAGGEVQGYLMEVVPDKALDARLTGEDVRVTVAAAATDGKALVVPVTALSSGADGRTSVTVRERSGTQRRVEVRPGTSGDGFVAVTPVGGGSLARGDRVVTGIRGGAADTGGEG
ncbi:peptidoglycan-binding protein [Streptomyces flaveus]|uniref:Peptidoglycan-binding protein n=1 Tax=Streptomyces flaveus TaxID=66370 RepID=A0A917RLV5_9ACTN|nr:peptidoglycan-binding protein [Streptomyces flaveus]GGL13801.1 hypothetical protein GCM10010094_88360 [Streptomyces flaveus]